MDRPYDLKQIRKEIEADERKQSGAKHIRMSQEEIKQMIEKKGDHPVKRNE